MKIKNMYKEIWEDKYDYWYRDARNMKIYHMSNMIENSLWDLVGTNIYSLLFDRSPFGGAYYKT